MWTFCVDVLLVYINIFKNKKTWEKNINKFFIKNVPSIRARRPNVMREKHKMNGLQIQKQSSSLISLMLNRMVNWGPIWNRLFRTCLDFHMIWHRPNILVISPKWNVCTSSIQRNVWITINDAQMMTDTSKTTITLEELIFERDSNVKSNRFCVPHTTNIFYVDHNHGFA